MANWGDDDDDNYEKDNYDDDGPSQMPQIRSKFFTTVNGDIKTITEFQTDESTGKVTKFIRKLKLIKKTVKINPAVLRRRKLEKFGDCAGLPPGPEPGITTNSTDIVSLTLRCRKKDEKEEEEDPFAKLTAAKNDSVVICRNCGEQGHWTLKCPKRNQIKVAMKDGTAITNAPGSRSLSSGGTGKYIPIHKRVGAEKRTSKFERDDKGTVRVTNISEDTTEDDLRELFRPFGYISRIYLAKDPFTRMSRGFAFISYSSPQQAQAAIDKLHGHGYDSLILNVEFAKPRQN